MKDNRIFHIKEDGSHKEPVSNFGIAVNASVDGSPDVGGPGFLLSIKRYYDNVEKCCT